jgi:hypothetical protein
MLIGQLLSSEARSFFLLRGQIRLQPKAAMFLRYRLIKLWLSSRQAPKVRLRLMRSGTQAQEFLH